MLNITKQIPKRFLVVGGVGAGAGAAARARRLNKACDIVVFEKGPYVSFANCGLPYFVGDVITEKKSLLVADQTLFREQFNVDCRLQHEVTGIDRRRKTLKVKDHATGSDYEESYADGVVVLATGTHALKPPLKGIDLPGVFTLRTIPDTESIKAWIKKYDAKHVTIVGAGFIGVEALENFMNLGLNATLVEAAPQAVPPLDAEMVVPLHDEIRKQGIDLRLNTAVEEFEKITLPDDKQKISVKMTDGSHVETDLVILCIGVRPANDLAKAASLGLGNFGGVRVDSQMRTCDEQIFAVGDCVEVKNWVTGEWAMVPLANGANRQGRVAADAAFGLDSTFRGSQGTCVVGFGNLTLASTGVNEKTLKKYGVEYEKCYTHPFHHAAYYPGAQRIHLKLLFCPKTGHVLGTQAVGFSGTDKRTDVASTTIQHRGTVWDLQELELAYAPQFGSAKSPMQMAGMIAGNHIDGLSPLTNWDNLPENALIVDVREKDEFEEGHVPDAINIPLPAVHTYDWDTLMKENPDRPIVVYCLIGQRGHTANCTLRAMGFKSYNASGGWFSWNFFQGNWVMHDPVLHRGWIE
eukprot:TRINITY_DN66806_c9_g5_i2.p1 TRINITY_DN66806_c9_g5~~TRINITY_DN66806_c9_g5_i2.p1  ORF type:complete len:596 (-),score=67.30 TRINITY_DN66806_c9_g5_i2:259-1995(-)